MIFYIAPFPSIMFKSGLKNSQWTDLYGPYSQINSLRKSNVFSCFLKFCTLSAALMLSGSSFQKHSATAQNALLPNIFRLVCGICNKFLVFDPRVLVLACLRKQPPCIRGILETWEPFQRTRRSLIPSQNSSLNNSCPERPN